MKKIIFLSISILIGILVYKENDEIVIPSDAIRVRIIANSNSIEDLYAKKKIKNEIKNDLYNIVKEAESFTEANKIIEDNLLEIDKIVSSKTSDYKINYGMNYFPQKNYKGVIYPSGEYRSLVITLGKGLGENWWCVLYPPLCMMEDNPDTTDVEYRSFVLNMLKIDNN